VAQLHGCLFHRAAAEFAGVGGQVREVGWRNRAPACVGDRLVVTGTVRSVDARGGAVTLDPVERCGAGGVRWSSRGEAGREGRSRLPGALLPSAPRIPRPSQR
jgi:hypothetical protein